MKAVFVVLFICVSCVNSFDFGDLLKDAKSIEDWIIQTRRELHKIPELEFDLTLTSAFVRTALDNYGISYNYPVATSGIVAAIGSGPGSVVGLRADMDALPIQEETGLAFASQHEGKMHACGHDAHTAMLLGAARLLKQRESSLNGKVKLVFQPAEEVATGAEAMLKSGELDDIAVMFGLHVWPPLQSGTVATRVGTFLAGASKFEITVKGKGGHASMPNLAIDPNVAVANMILAYQTIVSRRTSPLDSNVVSVSTIHGGTAFNIIPDSITFSGTLRTLQPGGMQELIAQVTEITNHVALAYRCTAELEFTLSVDPVVNDATSTAYAVDIAEKLLGKDHVTEVDKTMGAEDFALYGKRIPTTFLVIGMDEQNATEVNEIHTSRFKIAESILVKGAALHTALALNYNKEFEEVKTEL